MKAAVAPTRCAFTPMNRRETMLTYTHYDDVITQPCFSSPPASSTS